MAREQTPRPTDGAGVKRTLGAGTPHPVLTQLNLDLGGSDGPIIASGVGAQEHEEGSDPVTQKIKPTIGKEGTESVKNTRAKKIAEAQSRPPQKAWGVTADAVSRVLLTRIAEPMGVAPGDIMGLVDQKAVGPPDEIRLGLNGIPVDLKPPGTDVSKEQTHSVGQNPIGGLTLNDTTLKFDNKWDLESGKLTGSVALGQWTKKGAFTLEVDKEANAQFVVEGCEFENELMKGTIDMVFGSGGVGKSHFLYSTLFALDQGKDFMHWRAPVARRVLYIDTEMPERLIQKRLVAWFGDQKPRHSIIMSSAQFRSVLGQHFKLDNQTHQEILRQLIREFSIDVVIIDPLAPALDCDENSNNDVQLYMPFLTELRDDGVTIILSHHTGKSPDITRAHSHA